MYAECSKKEVESKPLVAASVGAGVVWSGVGTFMVALRVNLVWELSEVQSSCYGDLYGRPLLGVAS